MKQLYTLGLAAAVAVSASAQLQLPTASLNGAQVPVHRVAPIAKGKATVRKAPNGMTYKALPQRPNHKISLRPATPKFRAADSDAGFIEGFEGWDGIDEAWLPDGWTRQGIDNLAPDQTWSLSRGAVCPVDPMDGNTAMFCNCNAERYLDEWLVTPPVTVQEGMSLSYGEMVVGLYCFDTNLVDWDTFEFIGEPQQIGDFEVLISTDNGANWTRLRSVADQWRDKSFNEMLDGANYEFQKIQISLNDYVGQTVQIAFRNTGRDTNLVGIDAVQLGFAPIDVQMADPMGQLSFGISDDQITLGKSIGYNPAYTPLAWYNMSSDMTADFSWEYAHPMNGEPTMENGSADMLELTYLPKYKTALNGLDNTYTAPVLHGGGAAYAPASVKHHDFLSIGGKPALLIQMEGDAAAQTVNFGACPVDFARDGYTTAADWWTGMPTFGYDSNSDDYWTNYTFPEGGDANWVRMTKIINILATPDAPMIIRGGWLPAFFTCTDDAEFTMTVAPVSDEGEILFGTPMATATITGDMIEGRMDGEKMLCTARFSFPEPLVVDNATYPMYVVMISGFNDPTNVEYFCPLNSEKADPQGMLYGWLYKEICQNGAMNYSLSPIVNYTDKENGFYIMLDAEYAHLEADETDIELTGGEPREVVLDSYHDAAQLQVFDAPAWLKVELSGQGEQARMTLTGNGQKGQKATIMLQGLGAEKVFNVTMGESSSVGSVAAGENAPAVYYNLQGMRVDRPAKGQTYIKRQGTSAVKVVM